MQTKQLSIPISEDILIALNESEEELSRDMKIYTAIWLYIKGKLTIGKAAQLAGLSRYDFESLLSEQDVPISNLTLKEVKNDVDKLKDVIK
jgi:predicted HTH domain antitoxin